MAEGLIGGIFGGEDEKPEVEAPEALANAEAFAAAVAARLSASDPEVARDTSAFLKKQTQLLETQNKQKSTRRACIIFAVKRARWTSAGSLCAFELACRSFSCSWRRSLVSAR